MPTVKRIQIRFNCKKRLPSLIFLNKVTEREQSTGKQWISRKKGTVAV